MDCILEKGHRKGWLRYNDNKEKVLSSLKNSWSDIRTHLKTK